MVLRLAVLRGFAALRRCFRALGRAFSCRALCGDLRAVDDRLRCAAGGGRSRLSPCLRAVDLRAPVERLAVDLRGPRRAARSRRSRSGAFHRPFAGHYALRRFGDRFGDKRAELGRARETLLAACDALSAASSPASRIFLRAAGLAAIAAAAAVNPAASISLLIAALASFSTVLSFEREREEDALEPDLEEVEREELFRGDFAIVSLPASRGKTLYSRFGSRMKCEVRDGTPENVKGTAAYRSDALRHGQRPEMWPSVSF